MKRTWILLGLSLAVTACQWVPLTPAGKQVRVVSAADVAGCKQIATVTGKTTVTVGPMARDEAKIEREIEALARNEAASSGANVIVPKGPVDWDQRSYVAYRCEE
jgi:Domain of unknown function (DUF4156)